MDDPLFWGYFGVVFILFWNSFEFILKSFWSRYSLYLDHSGVFLRSLRGSLLTLFQLFVKLFWCYSEIYSIFYYIAKLKIKIKTLLGRML